MAAFWSPNRDVLTGWGAFRGRRGDDPYPLYARVREEAPVRPVVLADGRPAWIVTGYDEARQALLDSRLAKSVTGSWRCARTFSPPGCPIRCSATTCWPPTAPTTPGCAGWSVTTFTTARMAVLRPRVQDIVDELLDQLEEAPRSTRRRRSIWWAVSPCRFPSP